MGPDLHLVYDDVIGYLQNYTFSDVTNMSYIEVLRQSQLVLVPAGDAWVGGRLYQSLELGGIPILDAFDSFKGCEKPQEWLEKSGSPVILVDSWKEFKGILLSFLRDPQSLNALQEEVIDWWEGYKMASIDKILSFAKMAQSGEYTASHSCHTKQLSKKEEAIQLQAYNKYYSSPTWYEDFEDQPSYCALYCVTAIEEVAVSRENGACFDSACAPKPVSSFSCTYDSGLSDGEDDEVEELGEGWYEEVAYWKKIAKR